MSRYRSKLVQAVAALILLITSALLWPSLGAPATYASTTQALAPTATATSAVCPTPGNNACVSSINSTPTIGVTLNGTDQTLVFNVLFSLNNGVAGTTWHVTLALTQFTKAGTPTRTLPTSTNITNAVVTSSCTSNCPVNGITYPVSVTAGGSAVTFFNNTSTGGSHGVGNFTIQATFSISVPGNSYAGKYTSTVTLAFVSGSI